MAAVFACQPSVSVTNISVDDVCAMPSGQQHGEGQQRSEGEHMPDVLGTSIPDYEKGSIVHMPPMLFMAAHKCCDDKWLATARDFPVWVPLLNSLPDSWRDQEVLDCGAMVFKLQLMCTLLKQKDCQLSDLFPGVRGSRLGDTKVRVPEDDFVVLDAREHLDDAEFLHLVRSATTKLNWAWRGPGNKGADSWIILSTPGGGFLVLIVQSKKVVDAPLLKDSTLRSLVHASYTLGWWGLHDAGLHTQSVFMFVVDYTVTAPPFKQQSTAEGDTTEWKQVLRSRKRQLEAVATEEDIISFKDQADFFGPGMAAVKASVDANALWRQMKQLD